VLPPAAVRRPHRVAAGRRSATAATTRTRRGAALARVLRCSEADRRGHRARVQPRHDVGGPQPELVQGKPADDLVTQVRAPVVSESRVTRGVADDRPSQLLRTDARDPPREGRARIPASRSQGLGTVRARGRTRRTPMATARPGSSCRRRYHAPALEAPCQRKNPWPDNGACARCGNTGCLLRDPVERSYGRVVGGAAARTYS
jgi:hypothetical protein